MSLRILIFCVSILLSYESLRIGVIPYVFYWRSLN